MFVSCSRELFDELEELPLYCHLGALLVLLLTLRQADRWAHSQVARRVDLQCLQAERCQALLQAVRLADYRFLLVALCCQGQLLLVVARQARPQPPENCCLVVVQLQVRRLDCHCLEVEECYLQVQQEDLLVGPPSLAMEV